MEQERPVTTIVEYFSELEDPRRHNRRHKLLDIVVIAICGVICGAEGWEDIELFGEAKEEWLRGFLELPHGIPSDDTYRRVFAALDVEKFQNCFMDWIEAVEGLTKGQVVAADGKTLRRSHDRAAGKKALQMVSVWASANGLVLGQRKVDGESNEITAVPELLDTLEIAGCIVTLDAIHCQTDTAQTIVENGADYVLPVKENQPRLLEALQRLFDDPEEMRWVECDHHKAVNKGHGRLETRECWSTSDPDYLNYIATLAEWQDLRSIAMIQAERQRGEEKTVSRRYFISSLASDAEKLLHAVRTHWGIENEVHWVLDMVFREDDSRIRKGNGTENFAVLRHIALNLLKRDTSAKRRSLKGKRKKAAWDEAYLLKILAG